MIDAWKATALENLSFVCYQAVDFLTIIISVINLFWLDLKKSLSCNYQTLVNLNIYHDLSFINNQQKINMNFPDTIVSPLEVAKERNHVEIVKLLEADLATTTGENRLAEKNLA